MNRAHRTPSDRPFQLTLVACATAYVLLILAMLVADATFTSVDALWAAMNSPEIRYATYLSFVTATVTAIISLWFAVPIGYLLTRYDFRGKALLEAVLDIPIVLPPMVIGLSLLILFQTPIGQAIESVVPFTYRVPSVILAQFTVACAFAIRAMTASFEQIDPRCEAVALTLGCSRSQAFWRVALPQANRGILGAGLLAWARALGEFGPILVFSGATRMRTEVLPSSVFLELSIGNLDAAVAVSLILVTAAVSVLVAARVFGLGRKPAAGQ